MSAPSAPSGTTTPLPHPTRRNWLWASLQALCQVVFTLYFRYRARGIERIPATGGGLILANHQSFLDPLLVGLPLSRPVSFMARDSLFRVPVVGFLLRGTYVFPINRDAASTSSVRDAVARLKHGFLVGIFPEGTRSSDGQVGPFKPGFVSLVRRGKLPLYPVGIAGADEAMPRGAVLPRPRRVCVVFGEPLGPEELERLSGRGNEEALVEEARRRVLACQAEAEAWRSRLGAGEA